MFNLDGGHSFLGTLIEEKIIKYVPKKQAQE